MNDQIDGLRVAACDMNPHRNPTHEHGVHPPLVE
jgi:hypothetical protein